MFEPTGYTDVVSSDDDRYGVLVGWTHQDMGKRLVLRMQSVNKPPPHSAEDVHTFNYIMDKNQAVQLGNYLFKLTGQTAPRKKKRSWLDRLFEG